MEETEDYKEKTLGQTERKKDNRQTKIQIE